MRGPRPRSRGVGGNGRGHGAWCDLAVRAGSYIQLNIQITTFHSHVQTRNQEGKEGQEFPLFMLAEAIYMSWFTFELLVRLVS